jgi:hypothetical protein
MIRKSGYRFSEKIMLKSKRWSGMTIRRKVIALQDVVSHTKVGCAERRSCGAEASCFDAASAALPLEAAEVAASRHSRSYRHSPHRIRRPALVFVRAVVVRHFPCRRHRTSPN